MSAELNNDKLPSAESVERIERILQVGQIAFGKFEVLAQLGTGGMGQVYKVRDMNLDKTLALKVLHAHAREESSLIRFQNEARTASRLNHPSIATVYDFGLSEDGSPYMASEFIEGKTLEEVLAAGPLPVNLFLSIFYDVAEALDCAHRNGIIHRDIKPGNIMLIEREDGLFDTKVVDFGLAKKLDATESGGAQKATVALMGTPLYMSPEQCRGDAATPKSDLYSLGCVMYETIAGKPPFVGANVMETILLHQSAEPPSLKPFAGDEFSDYLLGLVQKLMEKNVSARFESAGAVASVLEKEIDRIAQIVEERADEEERQRRSDTDGIGVGQFGNSTWFQSGKLTVVVSLVILAVVAGFGFVAVLILSPKPETVKPLSYEPYVDPISGAVSQKDRELPNKFSDKLEDSLAVVSKSNVGKKLEEQYVATLPPIAGDGGFRDNSKQQELTDAQRAELLEATPENRKRAVIGVKNDINAGVKAFRLFVYGSLLDEDMKVFQNCQTVEDINAWSMPIGNDSLTYLSGLKNLRILKVSGTRINSMAKLNDVDNLRMLILENDAFNDQSIESVLKFKSLEKLDLRGTNVTTAGLAKLVNMPNLRDVALTIPSPKITIESMLKFAREHKTCKFLGTSEILLTFEGVAQKALKDNDFKKYISVHELMLKIMDHGPVAGGLQADNFRFVLLQGSGAANMRLGDKVAAEKYFKEAFEVALRMPDSAKQRVAALGLFNLANSNKNFSKAESVMKKWLSRCNQSEVDALTAYDCIRTLISSFDANKQVQKGKEWAQRLMELKGVGPIRHAAARAQYANSLQNLNENKRATPIFEESVGELRLLAKQNRNDESAQALALALYQFSLSQYFLKNYDRALRLNEEAIEESQRPNSIFILEGLLHERYTFLHNLKRDAEAARVKEMLAKATARREAVQHVQAAQAARKAKSSK